MTEEEIIRYCKALIKDMKMHHDVDNEVYIHENDYKAIEGLLDLYKKQQKQIEEYKSGEVFTAKQMHYIEDNYIDKDYIREEIKELLEEN